LITLSLLTGVPLSNARVLRNLQEHRHKSYIVKIKFFVPHFSRRQYGSIFNYFPLTTFKLNWPVSYRIR